MIFTGEMMAIKMALLWFKDSYEKQAKINKM